MVNGDELHCVEQNWRLPANFKIMNLNYETLCMHAYVYEGMVCVRNDFDFKIGNFT